MTSRNRRRRFARRVRGILGIVVLAGLVFSVASASSAEAKKPKPKTGKPDLTVTEAELTSDPYLFQGETNTVGFTDQTKNIGKARAKRSESRFYLKIPGTRQTGYWLTTRRVPALKPHESHGGAASDKWETQTGVLGGYLAGVCTNWNKRVAEEKFDNNCRRSHEVGIIPRRLTGTVSGSGPYLGHSSVTETWQGTTTWVFDQFVDPVFRYRLERADISFKDSGADGDCTFFGEGTATIVNGGSEDTLQITYGRLNHYLLNAAIPFTFMPVYTVHVLCAHGGSHDDAGPAQLLWLSSIGYKPLSAANGWTSLDDSTTAPDGTDTWKWNLTPK